MNRRMFVKAFPAFTALVGTASGFAHHPKSPVDGGKSVPAAPQVKEAVRNFGSDPHPDIIVGALSNQNWHRQIRRLGLDAAARLDYMIKKTAAIGKEFGFSPLSMDLGVAGLPSTDKAYLDEFKTRLAENKLWPVAGVGGVAVSYDDEVRSAALNTGRRNLEVAAYLGACRIRSATSREYSGVMIVRSPPVLLMLSVPFTVPVAGSIHSNLYVPRGAALRVIVSR